MKVASSDWLPQFYASCEVLLKTQGKTIQVVFENPEAVAEMIKSLGDVAAQIVARDIETHKASWAERSPDEQAASEATAFAWANRSAGHRVACPACKCQGLIRGARQGAVTTAHSDDVIVQRQTMLPATFECTSPTSHRPGNKSRIDVAARRPTPRRRACRAMKNSCMPQVGS